jgi:elongation factor 3
MEAIKTKLADKAQMEAGLAELETSLNDASPQIMVEAMELIPTVVDLIGDKQKAVATKATTVLKLYYSKATTWSASQTLPLLKKGLDGKAKPPVKEAVLEVVEDYAKNHKQSVGREVEWIVHSIVMLMNDIKKPVAEKAKSCMLALCHTCGNKDLEPFIPVVVKANESAKNVPQCVEELAGCIFVQNVEAPALSVTVPVLWRGLNEKSEHVKRRCCVIVDNMCKLIDDPREGTPLLKDIHALVRKCAESISDPEAREMAEKTLATVDKIAAVDAFPINDFAAISAKHGGKAHPSEAVMAYCHKASNDMINAKCYDLAAWEKEFGAFGFTAEMLEKTMQEMKTAGEPVEEEFIDEDETSPDLYKGSFSLAYGTLTLLRDTKLHLKKHKFYGLLGPNNCGKTTLMRAISNEQVEGFPKREELKTVFVEHEIEEREIEQEDGQMGKTKAWPLGKFNIDLSGIDYVVDLCNNGYRLEPPTTPAHVEAVLGEIGFKNKKTGVNPKAAADMCNPITTYSGGWKVKMQLGAAKIMNADILMLDEPTGHLDVKNIAWLKDWLRAFKGSIVATSHDRFFLEEMMSHVIWFDDRKLKQYKGEKGSCLSSWVALHPEKKSYFELTNKNLKFSMPPPGPLEGVKSKGRAILKMTNVAFRYPTHEKPTVKDICLSVCMLSRVAVIGPNGAGKSTAIKLLIGELKPEEGTVWKHSGMRMAYVAQHAFHHLEKHVKKTPVDYILWRFAGNDDRESLENANKELNDDEEALRKQKWCIDPKSGVVRKVVPGEKGDVPVEPDVIMNRRKNKAKKYEYEVKWMFKPVELSAWVERDTLVAMGYEKMVCKEDEKQAAAAGLMSRPLTAPAVEKHLKEFGMDAEAASHNPISALAGGQKVKVVLAAAMWQNPHILILDEPTNYLDRDGLGALTAGLQDYGGGVVIISHNEEFANSVATEKWIMDAGHLSREGEVVGDEEIVVEEAPDEIVDGSGNVVKVNKAVTMSEKDRKKAIKEIEKKLKEHKKKKHLSDAEMWELQDKLEEHKAQLGGS